MLFILCEPVSTWSPTDSGPISFWGSPRTLHLPLLPHVSHCCGDGGRGWPPPRPSAPQVKDLTYSASPVSVDAWPQPSSERMNAWGNETTPQYHKGQLFSIDKQNWPQACFGLCLNKSSISSNTEKELIIYDRQQWVSVNILPIIYSKILNCNRPQKTSRKEFSISRSKYEAKKWI